MAAAVTDKKIRVNPCATTKLPMDETDREVVPMSTEQMVAFREAVPTNLRAMIVLGAGTGMRQSEVIGLTLDRVDFLRRTERVDRQLVAVPAQPMHLGPPKTKKSVRTIPLPQAVVDAHLAVGVTRMTATVVVMVGRDAAREDAVREHSQPEGD